MTFMMPPHWEESRGSTSRTFLIISAQPRRWILGHPCSVRMSLCSRLSTLPTFPPVGIGTETEVTDGAEEKSEDFALEQLGQEAVQQGSDMMNHQLRVFSSFGH